MWLRKHTSEVCHLLGLTLIYFRIGLITAQQIGYINADHVRQLHSHSEFALAYTKYTHKQPVSTYDEENRPAGQRINNRRSRIQQQPEPQPPPQKQPQEKQQESSPLSEEDVEEDNEINSFEVENTSNFGNDQKRRNHHHHQQLKNVQNQPQSNIIVEQGSHKCRFWVPIEAVDKYKNARDLQMDDESQQLRKIEVCCKGYEPVRYKRNTVCHPYCESCQNGFCRAPNECECYEGFIKNDNGDCVFACPLGCLNGRCFLDGTCQCDPGYKLDETRTFCRPICSVGCNMLAGQNCTEPEVCGCAKGFQLKTDGCEPVCDPDCGIGGTCNADNVCKCERGYNLKDGTCQSDCYQSCDNGVCVSRNRCICNPNYRYHERSSMCIPI